MDEQHVAQFYDEVGSSYDRTLYFLACDPLYEAEIVRLSRTRRFRRVLDLGCGTGKQTVLLAPRAEGVWAIDLSAESLHQAEARCARNGFSSVVFGELRPLLHFMSPAGLPMTFHEGTNLSARQMTADQTCKTAHFPTCEPCVDILGLLAGFAGEVWFRG